MILKSLFTHAVRVSGCIEELGGVVCGNGKCGVIFKLMLYNNVIYFFNVNDIED